MPTPKDKVLYQEVKKKLMKSYKKNSAFASGAIVKEYKRLGGEYTDDNSPRPLKRWFQEKWVDVNPVLGILNDSAYPVFRPTVKVNDKTPTLFQNINKGDLVSQYKLKQILKGEKNLPPFLKIGEERKTKPPPKKPSIIGGMIVRSFPDNMENI